MKTFIAVPVAGTSPRPIRQPRAVQYKIASKRSLLARFQHFIESTDWEERYLCSRWIDKVCLGGIAVSMVYFVPLLLSHIQK
jgi:hypothetical protein